MPSWPAEEEAPTLHEAEAPETVLAPALDEPEAVVISETEVEVQSSLADEPLLAAARV